MGFIVCTLITDVKDYCAYTWRRAGARARRGGIIIQSALPPPWLTQNGVMEPDRLFQSPFTDISAQGPVGIFPPATVMQIVEVLVDIRERAVA